MSLYLLARLSTASVHSLHLLNFVVGLSIDTYPRAPALEELAKDMGAQTQLARMALAFVGYRLRIPAGLEVEGSIRRLRVTCC
jgi:hypothetical protein